jgi:CelD/BcsL family acetyltransferase involved in cellulose biosynthesis
VATAIVKRYPGTTLKVAISCVTESAGVASLAPDYEVVCKAVGNHLPFALHEWHEIWCRHFLNCDPRIEDRPLFYVVREETGTCVAILPFIMSQRRVGPLKFVSAGFLGADPAITEIRTPLVAPGYETLAVHAVRNELSKIARWDWVHWGGLTPALTRAVAGDGTLLWQEPQPDFVLDLPPSWPEFRARLKRNIRESLRHCYNSLRRDGHQFELQVIADRTGLELALDRFLELHVMRSRLGGTVKHANRFSSQVSRDFLYAVCDRLAARGYVRLFALKIRGRSVAMRLGFVVGDALYLYYSGYDPAWARYGVMTTTVAESIKYAIENGLRAVNLSPTRDPSKTRWSPRQVDYESGYEPGPRLRSRLANMAYLKARSDEHDRPTLLERLIARRNWR